jgi:hypothetical protein
MIADGKIAVAAKLIDPYPARLTHVRLITKNGRQFICGLEEVENRKIRWRKAVRFITKVKNTTPPSDFSMVVILLPMID